jgi:hypothetical protein
VGSVVTWSVLLIGLGTGAAVFEVVEWTPDRVRTHEAELRARDVENRVVVAVHTSSGRIAGSTV